MWYPFPHPLALLAALALGAPTGALAQLVTPRTVPVHQSEQFDIYPSSLSGMGGVSLALDDTLADPFVNPAKAARVPRAMMFALPFSHAVTGERGGGVTLPVGGMGGAGAWSFAGVAALQQLDRAGPSWNRPTSERHATNHYLSGAVASRLDAGLTLGFGAFHARLGAIDGVDLLYAGSDRIEQEGSVTDLRLGLVREWDAGRALEVMLLHNRTDVTHDVHFPALRRWDWRLGVPLPEEPERSERNTDRTHIWGAHTEYTLPVGTDGWRLGFLGTVNRLSHPKIPNYVIQDIPRDPGTTYALNAGIGASRRVGSLTWGIDVVYEPMRSETWADAAWDTTAAGGALIPAGERTVENDFRFSNARIRLGLGRETERGEGGSTAWQVGLSVHSISYRLEQTNHVLETFRRQRESWMEWTPTFAYHRRWREAGISYTLRATCGVGGCGLPLALGGEDTEVAAPLPGGVIAAPSGPLSFDGGSVWAHRFAVTVPLR